MAVSLARPGLRQQRSVLRAPGMRGLTHWWLLNDAYTGFSNPLAGGIQTTNTNIKPGNGPPFATPNSGALLNTSTSTILLSSSPILPSVLNQPTPAFSVSLWVNLTSLSSVDASTPRLIGWNAATGDNNSLNICGGNASGTADGSVAFTAVIGGTSTVTGTSNTTGLLTINRWHHVVLTYDGVGTGAVLADYTLYVDGVKQAVSAGSNLSTTANVFGIGSRDTTARITQGSIFDVRYAKGTTWTADEVAALYNSAFLPALPSYFVGVSLADILAAQIWL